MIMPRLGKSLAAAVLVFGVSCSQDVEDPTNFTAGNSQGGSTASNGSGSATTAPMTSDGTAVTNGNDESTGAPPGGSTTAPGSTSSPVGSSGGGPGACGNGVIDTGEQCDGANLQGFDCASLGLNGGTLACDPVMCMFDTSMCTAGPGTGGAVY